MEKFYYLSRSGRILLREIKQNSVHKSIAEIYAVANELTRAKGR
ncbi:hypothetical protein [uncultured Campylobacter sp.]|nr:hypothetical protein [uncultured Campylobacter sp.]